MPVNIPCRRNEYDTAKFPDFSKPTVVDHFSVDQTFTVHLDERFASHLRPDITKLPWPCTLDLTLGVDTFVECTAPSVDHSIGANGLIDDLCHFIVMSAQRDGHTDLKRATHGARFVSYRGTYTRIGATPCNIVRDNGWRIVARQVNGIIFLCEYNTEAAVADHRRQAEDKKSKLMTYGGHKFEDYVTVEDRKTSSPKTFTSPISDHEQFSQIYCSRLAGHELLYAAEMDCTAMETQIVNQHGGGEVGEKRENEVDVELKTQRTFGNVHQRANFYKYKAQKWWLQSFLVGIERIIVGYRDDNQVVSKVEAMLVKDIPKKAVAVCAEAASSKNGRYGHLRPNQQGNQNHGAFSPAANFAFLATVLNKIDEFYKTDVSDTYLKITWGQGMTQLAVEELATVEEKTPYDFLTNDIKSHFNFT